MPDEKDSIVDADELREQFQTAIDRLRKKLDDVELLDELVPIALTELKEELGHTE
jgi:hypothetical protein